MVLILSYLWLLFHLPCSSKYAKLSFLLILCVKLLEQVFVKLSLLLLEIL
uniref:Uncharacterized protein n=1 Tax=Rhizophora mucronata TaxID=61149 RepID=A0A2P2N873_RHIMU